VRAAILEALQAADKMTFRTLVENVRRDLAGTFDGSISWCVTTVRLDLEARGRSSAFLEGSHSIFAWRGGEDGASA
jgi:hypothetical protein